MAEVTETQETGEKTDAGLKRAQLKEPMKFTDSVPLEGVIEFGDEDITEIRMHRSSAEEIDAYIESLRNGEGGLVPPGVECDPEVWKVMLDDDKLKVEEKYDQGFFPQRLKGLVDLMGITSDKPSD